MPIDQLAAGAAAALGDDNFRQLLAAAIGLATGEVRGFTVELGADRRPIIERRHVVKGQRLPG